MKHLLVFLGLFMLGCSETATTVEGLPIKKVSHMPGGYGVFIIETDGQKCILAIGVRSMAICPHKPTSISVEAE